MIKNTFLALLITIPFLSNANISITTSAGSNKELKIESTLNELVKKYDIDQWFYTSKVLVNEKARVPHSHPVLTMNTAKAYLESDIRVLSTFLHEQFHWHVVLNGKGSIDEFRGAIKREFPKVEYKRPLGSGDEGGTLTHLVVCYLEYRAMASLIGERDARALLESNPYYTWIYKTILDKQNHSKLDKLVQELNLTIFDQGSDVIRI
ncbi:hypothetical protein [Pseudoalteromonas luteoviolacea]|uniref:Uncharacterized protein n=1 Tax=Pseudoalteromonas luteoviolacea S4054 TaxID=1129367 RepID=A0A0F6AI92_9GAMM|nr:hypothetical protein [Pseudoalteromonas luteoviolacea]AOT07873.1 hypothetical protein S4054249_08480 [Pseudoalteromonas luteoviolacea]AOT12789.1 hypothetical protein S40542_08480 [Pseudoalteromonas luteoviolacea]AOT17702.1 hypothetical protein S4054_08475 [Pseudoalteromonas luteoviolacea]KKE85888.1 hypothetical protein N479_00510 [Pseudoalteromonas luteoviolacea S4054]KZN74766.1 hypothetical protein N481_08890 [Pseudoalteromonas luteoviolacea S4047-1]